MRNPRKRFTVIDLLMLMALLLIVAGMFAPHFASKRSGQSGVSTANPAPMSRPLR